MKRKEFIDFLNYLAIKKNTHLDFDYNELVDEYLKSINSNEPNESEADSNNEQLKEFCFRCGKPNDNDCDICYECTEEIQKIDKQNG